MLPIYDQVFARELNAIVVGHILCGLVEEEYFQK